MKRSLLALAIGFTLGGCSLAPVYQPAKIPAPAAFHDNGPWAAGEPADRLPRGAWWTIFGDAGLNQLEQQVNTANPTLAAAVAHFDASRAELVAARSGLFPEIGAGASMNRNRQSDNRPLRSASQPSVYNADTVGLDANYEVDMWGQVRNQVDAGTAGAQAAAADMENVRLSLQAELANDYFQLRGLDAEARLLQDTVTDYSKALELTRVRHEGGIASGLDVGRAETQLDSAQAAVDDVAARRSLYEHAIAALIGQPAGTVSVPASLDDVRLPHVPVGVPSTLLQRRPDIAAAERRAAAANADIGVAKAAFYPVIDIDATGGYQSTSAAHWLSAPNAFWSLGPAMVVDLFDAGRRQAQVDEAKQRYVEASSDYRARVLEAFKEVEDNLSLLANFSREAESQQQATDAARRTEALAMDRYREGVVNYLEVVTAQTAALQAERADILLKSRRLQASVALVRAVGGGWSSDDLPNASQLGSSHTKPDQPG